MSKMNVPKVESNFYLHKVKCKINIFNSLLQFQIERIKESLDIIKKLRKRVNSKDISNSDYEEDLEYFDKIKFVDNLDVTELERRFCQFSTLLTLRNVEYRKEGMLTYNKNDRYRSIDNLNLPKCSGGRLYFKNSTFRIKKGSKKFKVYLKFKVLMDEKSILHCFNGGNEDSFDLTKWKEEVNAQLMVDVLVTLNNFYFINTDLVNKVKIHKVVSNGSNNNTLKNDEEEGVELVGEDELSFDNNYRVSEDDEIILVKENIAIVRGRNDDEEEDDEEKVVNDEILYQKELCKNAAITYGYDMKLLDRFGTSFSSDFDVVIKYNKKISNTLFK